MSGRLSSHSLDLPRQRSKIPLLARPETRTCWGVQANAPHRSLASSRKAMLLVITVFFDCYTREQIQMFPLCSSFLH